MAGYTRFPLLGAVNVLGWFHTEAVAEVNAFGFHSEVGGIYGYLGHSMVKYVVTWLCAHSCIILAIALFLVNYIYSPPPLCSSSIHEWIVELMYFSGLEHKGSDMDTCLVLWSSFIELYAQIPFWSLDLEMKQLSLFFYS